jgi:hypothetical protein
VVSVSAQKSPESPGGIPGALEIVGRSSVLS